MNEYDAIRTYGWAAILIIFLLRDVWPWLRDKVWPAHTVRLQNLEERQVASFEKIAEAVNTMALTNVSINFRLEQIVKAHEDHDHMTRTAITDMYKRVGLETVKDEPERKTD